MIDYDAEKAGRVSYLWPDLYLDPLPVVSGSHN